MLECLLAFLARWLWVALVPEAEGGDSPTPPTPAPPPPAAKAGVNEGAATSAIENAASAANLMIIQLAMQTSCIPARGVHDPAKTVYPGWLQTFPESLSANRDLTVMLSYVALFCESQSFARVTFKSARN